MSRHRRQRNRRWQATKATADRQRLALGVRVLLDHGRLSTQLTPLERLLVLEETNKRLGLIKVERTVLTPAGYRYDVTVKVNPKATRLGWKRLTGISPGGIELEKASRVNKERGRVRRST